jgi:hypothetical protein
MRAARIGTNNTSLVDPGVSIRDRCPGLKTDFDDPPT